MPNARNGLGKGLNVLFADAAEESGSNKTRNELPLDEIVPNPNQPRLEFDDAALDELAASIKKEGLLQPIVVRQTGNKYQIIAGERRWQACRKIGLESVPVKIMQADEAKAIELALIENLQRSNLNPIEEAKGYRSLIEASGMTQSEIAESVSKSRATITNALRLLDLPDEVQNLLYEAKLTAGHARAILAVPDDDKRVQLAQKVIENRLSVRETENLARLFSVGDVERTKRPPTPRTFKNVARKLRIQLGTGVSVKNSRGKNRIEIEFSDEDDLERIFSIISGKGEGTDTSREES